MRTTSLFKMGKRSNYLQTIKEHEDSNTSYSQNQFKNNEYLMKVLLCLILSLIVGYQHMCHVEQLFENDKHFSHLSTLERELSFRTENGLYYYYFKILVEPESAFISGITNKIISDNRTEYPTTINSLRRFNLYPEIVLAFVYRVMRSLNLLGKTCWKVERDDEMPSVESCDGYLEPIYFYSKSILKYLYFLRITYYEFLYLRCFYSSWFLGHVFIHIVLALE